MSFSASPVDNLASQTPPSFRPPSVDDLPSTSSPATRGDCEFVLSSGMSAKHFLLDPVAREEPVRAFAPECGGLVRSLDRQDADVDTADVSEVVRGTFRRDDTVAVPASFARHIRRRILR